jgi:hypothetical protein
MPLWQRSHSSLRQSFPRDVLKITMPHPCPGILDLRSQYQDWKEIRKKLIFSPNHCCRVMGPPPHIEYNFNFAKVLCPGFLAMDALSKTIPQLAGILYAEILALVTLHPDKGAG